MILQDYIILGIGIALIVLLIKGLIRYLKNDKETEGKNIPNTEPPEAQNQKGYEPKRLLTPTEVKFYEAIKQATPPSYIVYPQINLASIINRTDEHTYQNELYRNIDFAIFNENYFPIVLLEINDKSHNEPARRARDIKVKEILLQANLPLVTLWTNYGVNQEYINKRLAEYF